MPWSSSYKQIIIRMYVLLAVISFCLIYPFIACGATAEALVNSVGGSE